MDLKKMEYFIAAAEEGTFTKAAARCYISQTAISQQIAAIEKELNVVLFDRSKYRPKLTPAGTRFYASCRQILSFYEQAVKEVKELEKQNQKEINIGITGSFERLMLTDILRSYVQIYPDVTINLVECRAVDCIEKLEDGELDVIFVITDEMTNNAKLDVVQINSQNITVLVPPGHRFADRKEISGAELKDEKFIVFSPKYNASIYNAFISACQKDGYTPNVVQEVESPYDIVLLVSLGKGIAITSQQVQLDKKMLHSIKLVNSAHQGEYCLAKEKHNNAKEITSFIDIAVEISENE